MIAFTERHVAELERCGICADRVLHARFCTLVDAAFSWVPTKKMDAMAVREWRKKSTRRPHNQKYRQTDTASAPLDVYLFTGVARDNLHLLHVKEGAAGRSTLLRVLQDFQTQVRGREEIPGVLLHVCGAALHDFFPDLERFEEHRLFPETRFRQFSSTVVLSRYMSYASPLGDRSELTRELLESLVEAPGRQRPPPALLSFLNPLHTSYREWSVKIRSMGHLVYEAMEACGIDTDFFQEMDDVARFEEEQKPFDTDVETELQRRARERWEAEEASTDGISQQFFENMARKMVRTPLATMITPNAGRIEGLSEKLTAFQVSAACFSTLATLESFCRFCRDPATAYAKVLRILGGGVVANQELRQQNHTQCSACGTLLALVAAVEQLRGPDRNTIAVNKYTPGHDTFHVFHEALVLFSDVDRALEFQRPPWRFSNFSLYPVQYTVDPARTATFDFSRSPTICHDGSLHATVHCINQLFGEGVARLVSPCVIRMPESVARDLQNTMTASHSLRSHQDVTGLDTTETSLDREAYLHAEDVGVRVDTVPSLRNAHLVRQLSLRFTPEWPLMAHNFIHGSTHRLYWSMLWMRTRLYQTRVSKKWPPIPVPTSPQVLMYRELLPALLEKMVSATEETLFDLFTEPFQTEGRSLPVDTQTGTLFSGLCVFIHSSAAGLILDDRAVYNLGRALSEARHQPGVTLPPEGEQAFRLCNYLLQQTRKRKRSRYYVRNPFGDAENPLADEFSTFCDDGQTPLHYVLYRAALLDCIPASVTREVFLGVAQNRNLYPSKACKTSALSETIPVNAGNNHRFWPRVLEFQNGMRLIEQRARWVDREGRRLSAREQLVADLFMLVEVFSQIAPGRQTFSDSERLLTRAQITEERARWLGQFKNASAALADPGFVLPRAWLPSLKIRDSIELFTTKNLFPVWMPLWVQSAVDVDEFSNITPGANDLAPFTGAHPEFLECILSTPLLRVSLDAPENRRFLAELRSSVFHDLFYVAEINHLQEFLAQVVEPTPPARAPVTTGKRTSSQAGLRESDALARRLARLRGRLTSSLDDLGSRSPEDIQHSIHELRHGGGRRQTVF